MLACMCVREYVFFHRIDAYSEQCIHDTQLKLFKFFQKKKIFPSFTWQVSMLIHMLGKERKMLRKQ